MNPEDYECEVTAPRVYVRAGQDVQPSGLSDLVVGVVCAVILVLVLAIGT